MKKREEQKTTGEQLRYIHLSETDDGAYEIVIQISGGGTMTRISRGASSQVLVANLRHLAELIELSVAERAAYGLATESQEADAADAGSAKLTEEQVREIRARLAAGETHQEIADDYGVSARLIGNINTGKSWGWLI